jgi:hypothetical protein
MVLLEVVASALALLVIAVILVAIFRITSHRGKRRQTEHWVILGFATASWLTPVLAMISGITFQLHVWLDAWLGVEVFGGLVTLLLALTIWAQYVSVGILGISLLFGLGVFTVRTVVLSVAGAWLIATIHARGMPNFRELDIQAVLFISIISLSTIFLYQVSKRKG